MRGAQGPLAAINRGPGRCLPAVVSWFQMILVSGDMTSALLAESSDHRFLWQGARGPAALRCFSTRRLLRLRQTHTHTITRETDRHTHTCALANARITRTRQDNRSEPNSATLLISRIQTDQHLRSRRLIQWIINNLLDRQTPITQTHIFCRDQY